MEISYIWIIDSRKQLISKAIGSPVGSQEVRSLQITTAVSYNTSGVLLPRAKNIKILHLDKKLNFGLLQSVLAWTNREISSG